MDQSLGSFRDAVPINIASTDFDPTALTPARGASRGVYVTSNGNLTCRLSNSGTDVLFTGLLAGTVYWFSVSLVRKTGTTIAGSLLY